MGFADDLRVLCERAGKKAEMVVRKTALDLGGQMIDRSPVGNPDLWKINKQAIYMRETHNLWVDAINADIANTGGKKLRRMGKRKLKQTYKLAAGQDYTGGRFKNNWRTAVGSAMDRSTIDKPDSSGLTSRVLMDVKIEGWRAGRTIWITNSLPYAKKLEFGHSKQAPTGIVRLTVQNYAQAVAKAVAEVRSK